MAYDFNTPMPIGKHLGTRLIDLPIDYIINFANSGSGDIALRQFFKDNIEKIKEAKATPFQIKKYMPKCPKVAFPTKEAAKRKMQEIKNINERSKFKYNHEREKVPVRAYECPDCGGWHLTSKELEETKN